MKRVAWAALAGLGLIACATVLGLRKPGAHVFEHRAHVLEGVSCVECHAGIEDAGDTGPLHIPSDDRCRECHKKPHDNRPCSGCHGMPYTVLGAMQAREHVRFAHKRHLDRAPGTCMRCHGAVARDEAKMRPSLGVCVGCHEHRDKFANRECSACHVDLIADVRPPEDHLIHGDDFMTRHAASATAAPDLCASCHRERFCASCHGASVPALPSRLTFDDPQRAGVHRAGFRARHSEEARIDPGLCQTCHTEETCRSCHDDRRVSAPIDDLRRNPHPPGWVGPGSNEHGRAARRDPASCASCHGGAGEALCVGCHRVGGIGGNPHPPGWSSRKDTHEAPCRACHVGVL